MRRARRLTVGERWEVGVFLGMLSVGCVCLTAVFHFNNLPRLFGFAFEPPADVRVADVQAPMVGDAPATVIRVSSPGGGEAARPVLAPEGLPSLVALEPTLGSRSKVAKKPAEEIRWYKGEKYRYVKTLRLKVTAYAADPRCCWPFPGTTTASGMSVKTNHGKLVAADTEVIPMHALVAVPGYGGGTPVPVLDRGGAIKGPRLDVLLPTFELAKEWGTRVLEVKVYMPVE